MINEKRNTEYVMRKLSITHLEYCLMVERGGYDWIDRHFAHEPEMTQYVCYSKKFWQWWVNEWEIRDHSFVYETRFMDVEQSMLHKIYNASHNIQSLHVVPNKFVLIEIRIVGKDYINKELIKQLEQQPCAKLSTY